MAGERDVEPRFFSHLRQPRVCSALSERPKMRTRPTSRLRLDRPPHPLRDARSEKLFRQAVAHEMLLAREAGRDKAFDPTDARWRLATETQQSLQGAVLAYEDRRRLLSLAQRLGIRAFDANLILAIVQDRARRGEPLETAASTIAIVPRPARAATTNLSAETATETGSPSVAARDHTLLWIGAVVVAMAVDAALIIWLIFG